MLFETFLGLLAAIPIILIVKIGIKDNCLNYLLPSIAYLFGSFVSWVLALLVCIYFEFSLPGHGIIKYPIVILFLVNLVTWGGLVGTTAALTFNKKTNFSLGINLDHIRFQGFKLAAIIFIAFWIINIISGGLNLRYEVGNTLSVGSVAYFLAVINILQLLVFIFAGMCCTDPLLSRRNIIFIITPLIGALLLSLSGGRESSVSAFILFFFGTFYSKLRQSQIKLLVVIIIPIVIILIIAVGDVRGNSSFSDASPLMRALQMYETTTQGGSKSGTDYDDSTYLLFTRIIEPSGVAVIETILERNQNSYIGLENIERVGMIFLPKIVTGSKNYDDSSERLVKYGYLATELTSAPITLMADCFERGGYIAVFLVSILVSFILTKISFLLMKIRGVVGILMTLCFGLGCARIYVMSLLTAINFLTFVLLRDLLFIYIFCNLVNRLSSQSKNQFYE
jgi:hypothetical protein